MLNLENITPEQIEAKTQEVQDAFADRLGWEKSHRNSDTLNGKLEDLRDDMSAPAVVKMMIALDINPAFVNKPQSVTQRFDEKAIKRAIQTLEALARNNPDHANHCVKFFVVNAASLAEKGVDFTNEFQSATCSSHFVGKKRAPGIKRISSISANVAPRQANMTRQTLIALGVASKYDNENGEECLRVNLEHPIAGLFLTPSA